MATACSIKIRMNTTVEVKASKVYYVITGFSAFGSVGINPTAKLIEILSDETNDSHLTRPNSHSVYMFKVLEVSVQAVDSFLNSTVEDIVKRDSDSGISKIQIYFIHLGVDENAISIKLEQVCYNNLHFRIPDVKGYQPQNSALFSHFECDFAFPTQLDVLKVLDDVQTSASVLSMQHQYLHPLITLSTNPGRYLCNYVYLRTNTLYRACGVYETTFGGQCECSD
ncbi:hypothetical protein EON65_51200, partial [archaeon]